MAMIARMVGRSSAIWVAILNTLLPSSLQPIFGGRGGVGEEWCDVEGLGGGWGFIHGRSGTQLNDDMLITASSSLWYPEALMTWT